jgi:histone H3/H4
MVSADAYEWITQLIHRETTPVLRDAMAIAVYMRHKTLSTAALQYALKRAAEQGRLPRFAGKATL